MMPAPGAAAAEAEAEAARRVGDVIFPVTYWSQRKVREEISFPSLGIYAKPYTGIYDCSIFYWCGILLRQKIDTTHVRRAGCGTIRLTYVSLNNISRTDLRSFDDEYYYVTKVYRTRIARRQTIKCLW